MSDNFQPSRCVSNVSFAEQFPRTLARAKKRRLTGTVLSASRREPDVYVVKWDHLKLPWKLHRSFFTVKDSPNV